MPQQGLAVPLSERFIGVVIDVDCQEYATVANPTDDDLSYHYSNCNHNGLDPETYPEISFNSASLVVPETATETEIDLPVSLSFPTNYLAKVKYSFHNLVSTTNSCNQYYDNTTGILEFAPGQNSGIIKVKVLPDQIANIDKKSSNRVTGPN